MLTVDTNPTSPFLLGGSFSVPPPKVCVSTFAAVRSRMANTPWRGSFAGTVCGVQPLEETGKGEPKRKFELVDNSGSWFQCCALGKQALARSIKNGSQVVVFFVTARPGTGDESGTAYLFRESCMIRTGTVDKPPTKRVRIEIL